MRPIRFLLIILALLFTLWFTQFSSFELWFAPVAPKQDAASHQKQEPADSYFTNFISQRYSEKGQLISTLSGTLMEHRDSKQMSNISQPLYEKKGLKTAIQLSAKSGELDHAHEILTLEKNAKYLGVTQSKKYTTQFFTEHVDYHIKTNLLKNEVDIKLLEGSHQTTTGNGLRADIEKGFYQILREVKSSYEVH